MALPTVEHHESVVYLWIYPKMTAKPDPFRPADWPSGKVPLTSAQGLPMLQKQPMVVNSCWQLVELNDPGHGSFKV